MRGIDNFYIVKYVDIETDECYTTTYVHKDMIESFLAILKFDKNGTVVKLGDLYYRITDFHYTPSLNADHYTVLYLSVEEV